MSRTVPASQAQTERHFTRFLIAVAVVVGGFLVYAGVATVAAPREPSPFDPSLPNPMGGTARTAPGTATGEVALGGLAVSGSEIAMGDVALDVTYVPAWEVRNPGATDVALVVGQPQVLEGCCPGPVYVNGELTQAGQELTVPAGGVLTLQFPLQMHAGMDGPHHLALPLTSGDVDAAVHVTGNFTSTAS